MHLLAVNKKVLPDRVIVVLPQGIDIIADVTVKTRQQVSPKEGREGGWRRT